MAQAAITSPYTTFTEMTGETIKGVVEDVVVNLFNLDPYHTASGEGIWGGQGE
jgi:hypothetical protein